MTKAEISAKASFEFIRYASVWEDADILCDALAPVAQGGRLLSIASSGDNALALLTLDPKEVVAADLSAAQLACVELRMAAFRHLDHEALLAFLGVTQCSERPATYQKLRDDLSSSAAAFWDAHPEPIYNGIIHAGKFERYLRTFGKKILPLIHAKWKRNALLFPRNTDEQINFYDQHWNTWLWRAFFKVFFSRTFMGLLGRDPAFFDHVQGSVADKILARTRHAMTQLPTFSNPYLVYILTGNYMSSALPRYLRPEHKDAITARLDKLTLYQGPIQEASSGRFDGFNLSDIFEYMSDKEFTQCYGTLLQRANPLARLAYWNMLVPRQAPLQYLERVQTLDQLSRGLHFHDKAWFYQAFRVESVC